MTNTVREEILRALETEGLVRNKNKARCSRCGCKFPKNTMLGSQINNRTNGKYRYTCVNCLPNTRYHGNEVIEVGTPTADLMKNGMELEMNFINESVRNWFYDKQWSSTNDSSLHDEEHRGATCEMVSPLTNGFNRLNKQINTIGKYLEEGLIEMNDSCGTHFHVSVNGMVANGENLMNRLRNNRKNIFGDMEKLMLSNPQKTKEFFGRNFTHYANTFAHEHVSSRYAWLNLTRNTDIEFRLNKFVTAKQYHDLCNFEIALVRYIVKNANDPNVKYSEMRQTIAQMLEKAWA